MTMRKIMQLIEWSTSCIPTALLRKCDLLYPRFYADIPICLLSLTWKMREMTLHVGERFMTFFFLTASAYDMTFFGQWFENMHGISQGVKGMHGIYFSFG